MRAAVMSLLLVACGGDGALKVVNTPPDVAIMSPPEGTSVDEYSPIVFEARVSDPNEDEENLTVVWSSDIDGEFPGPFVVSNGQTTFETANLSDGNHTMRILVVDSGGASGEDTIQITVVDRPEAPTVQIVHPVGGDEIIEGDLFEFVAVVEDVQDPADSLVVSFESDIDGVFCNPTPDAVGVASCEATLTPGDHLLTYTATDTSGESGATTTYWAVTSLRDVDNDGDGFTEEQGDCNDEDGSVYPGAEEFYNGRDDDCDGVIDDGTEGFDDDGDGFAEIDGDCDDASDTTYPGADEVCDSLDNDCDTVIDEGTTCYDDDGDGWREIDGDCDDGDATSYPGATELADGADNDCDGTVDEETINYDDDGDGYAEISGDCDDTDPAVSPAGTEVCNDGKDNDCDGTENEANADGCTTWYYDYDGDGYGSTSSQCLCSSDGYYTSRYNTDCYDLNADASPAATSWNTNDRGDGSFDYNCDGTASKRFTSSGSCSGAVWICTTNTGWQGSVAGCGASRNWITNCSGITCGASTRTEQQECR